MSTVAVECMACSVRIEVNDQGTREAALSRVFDVLTELKYSENRDIPPFMRARGRAFVSIDNPAYGIHVSLRERQPLILSFGSGRTKPCLKAGADLVTTFADRLAAKLGVQNVKLGEIELERP